MKATLEHIKTYCEAHTHITNARFADSGDTVNTVSFEPSQGGKVYIRIVRKSYCHGQHAGDSAHLFVKLEDGTLWKPAGWKGPTKNFSRGSVFDVPATV